MKFIIQMLLNRLLDNKMSLYVVFTTAIDFEKKNCLEFLNPHLFYKLLLYKELG